MLHIIAQYKQLCASFIITTLAGNAEGAPTPAISEKNELTLQEKNKFIGYRESILDFDIGKDKNNQNKVKSLQLSLNALNIKGKDGKELSEDGDYGSNTLHALEVATGLYIKHGLEEAQVLQESQEKTQDLSEVLPKAKPVTTVEIEEPIQTMAIPGMKVKSEKVIKTKENFGAIKGTFGQRIEGTELRKIVNISSLNQILKKEGLNINTLYSELAAAAEENNARVKTNKNGEKYTELYFDFFNMSEVEKIIEDYGYESDGIFAGEEMAAVFQIIEDVVITQKLIPNLGFEEKKRILLDYDINGVLDKQVHFHTKETDIFDAIKNEAQFSNLLLNLGYNGVEEFNEKFGANYFAAREEFKTRLGSILSIKPPLNPSEMLNNSNSVREYSELMTEINRQVSEEVDNNDRLREFKQETKERIKLQTIGVLVGSSFGVGVSYDIKELTKNIIDSAFIGYVAGVPGIGISKNIIDLGEGRVKVDIGAVNLVPYASASLVIEEGKLDDEEFKKLFPEEIDASTEVILGGAASSVLSSVVLNAKRVDEKSEKGIRLMKEQMSKRLDSVFENIKDGKTFEESDFNGEMSNKIIYERLSDLFNNSGLNTDLIKEGTLENYERVLYENSDGLNFTGIGEGLVFVAGYMPIPIILVHGENHDIEWNEVNSVTIAELKNIANNEKATITHSEYVKGINTNNEALAISVKGLDNTITFRTRSNKYSDEIMDPNATNESRWAGFTKFANRELKFSKELNLTIDSFKSVLLLAEKSGPITDNDKLYIISTITQLMKKANDTNEGSIENYNRNYHSIIKMKNARRSGYNELFGFNTDKLSGDYDTKLIEAGEAGKIGEINVVGISFDASSPLNVGLEGKPIKGVDVHFSNIQILSSGDEPILVPITKKEHQEYIDKFIIMLKGKTNLDEEIKKYLIEGIKSGEIVLHYYSDPDGFDDRIIPVKKGTAQTVGGIQVYQPITSSVGVGLGIAGRTQKKPDRDDRVPPDDTPAGTSDGGSGSSSGGTGGGGSGF